MSGLLEPHLWAALATFTALMIVCLWAYRKYYR